MPQMPPWLRAWVPRAGLRPKTFGAGAGWDSLRGGCGLEVCGCGRSGQDFSNLCGCRAGPDKKFQPAQDSNG